MLGDMSSASKIYLITGRTDLRMGISGLANIVRSVYELDPFSNSIFMFCGKRTDRIKVLYHEKDGFCLYYKVLESGSRFQWPRNSSEARLITRQQLRWLCEGLKIDQPTTIQTNTKGGAKNI